MICSAARWEKTMAIAVDKETREKAKKEGLYLIQIFVDGKHVERPASPAAHSTKQARRLADESPAIRGRVHAFVRRGVTEIHVLLAGCILTPTGRRE